MRFIIIPLLFLFTACSSKQVHIYNYGYSSDKINRLKVKIEAHGYTVKSPNVSIPKEFPDTAIALNPNFTDQTFYQQLNLILIEEDIGMAQEFRFAEGRHFYSTNDIGLYLRNPNFSQVAMPAYIRTQYCQSSFGATILFDNHGRFVLEYEANYNDEQLAVEKGWFEFDGKHLTLNPHNLTSQQFHLVKEERETPYGLRPADVYKPLKKAHELGSLNCEFIIIYI